MGEQIVSPSVMFARCIIMTTTWWYYRQAGGMIEAQVEPRSLAKGESIFILTVLRCIAVTGRPFPAVLHGEGSIVAHLKVNFGC